MSTILMYIIGALLLACGVFAFLWQRCKRKFAEAISAGIIIGRDIERKASDKLIEGLENEGKVTGSIDDGKFLD